MRHPVLALLLVLGSPAASHASPEAIERVVQAGRPAFDHLYAKDVLGGAAACLPNSDALARELVKQGVHPAELRMLYIDAKGASNGARFTPRPWALRREERHDTSFSYHFALVTRDNRVFDLSAEKSLWGADLRTYARALFGHAKGAQRGVRLINTTLEQLAWALEPWKSSGAFRVNSWYWGEVGHRSGGGVTDLARLDANLPPDQLYTVPKRP